MAELRIEVARGLEAGECPTDDAKDVLPPPVSHSQSQSSPESLVLWERYWFFWSVPHEHSLG